MALGFVGVSIAPSSKWVAFGACTFASCIVALFYFSKYNDWMGGLAAMILVVATALAGSFAAVTQQSSR
jgi:hypothetical protein